MVEKPLLFRGERRITRVEQPAPVRPAGEELAVPPHGAGFDRVALGLRHRRHQLAEGGEHRVAHELAPQRRHVARNREQHEDERQREREPAGNRVRVPGHAERDGDRGGERQARGIDVGQRQRGDEDGNDPDEGEHRRLLQCECKVGMASALGRRVSSAASGRHRPAGRRPRPRAAAIAAPPAETGRGAAATPRRSRSRRA